MCLEHLPTFFDNEDSRSDTLQACQPGTFCTGGNKYREKRSKLCSTWKMSCLVKTGRHKSTVLLTSGSTSDQINVSQ